MKAILLAGGKGTRLRPLTIHTPKPIVPIFDRAFLHYQIDQLKRVPEIDEVILSLNYQPRRIEEIFGDGGESGLAIKYVVEPAPRVGIRQHDVAAPRQSGRRRHDQAVAAAPVFRSRASITSAMGSVTTDTNCDVESPITVPRGSPR